ncbi:opsin Rh2 [Rhagoletis pomonella]|uniref:opsin Rh2 n=1 Tax=Rhagoletis pomonella TaxID=28610 RepID=UPI001785C677|nr:opsin Rh2 [Rhagoletis pomonella]
MGLFEGLHINKLTFVNRWIHPCNYRLSEVVELQADEGVADLSNASSGEIVTPDMAHLVNPYWSKFPPMNSTMSQVLGIYTLILLLFSSFGNGVVVYIFGSAKSLRTPANLLVLNLAFSDFCMMVSQAPVMIINFYYETWILGPLWCDIYSICGSMFGCVSIWSMCMIALDRYNVIVKGVSGRPMTTKLAVRKISGIWMFATFWTLLPLLGWSRYVPEGNLTACTIDYMTRDWNPRSYLLIYSSLVYFTPLFLICYSYWFIIDAVAAHEKAMSEQAKKMNVKSLRSSRDCEKSTEAKLAKVALTTIALWFMSWTPYVIICYCGFFGVEGMTPLSTIWGATFAKTGAACNPIVYGISHPKYRLVLKEKCPCCIFGSTEEDKPDAPASESQGTADAESNA